MTISERYQPPVFIHFPEVQVQWEYGAHSHSEVTETSHLSDAVFISLTSSRCHYTVASHLPTARHAPLHHHTAAPDTRAAQLAVRSDLLTGGKVIIRCPLHGHRAAAGVLGGSVKSLPGV